MAHRRRKALDVGTVCKVRRLGHNFDEDDFIEKVSSNLSVLNKHKVIDRACSIGIRTRQPGF